MTTKFTLKDFEQADSDLRAAQSRTHFYAHTLAYVITNLVLVILNLILAPAFPWVIIPVVVWGIVLVVHYMMAFRWIETANVRWMERAEYLAGEMHRANEILVRKVS